MLSSIIEAIVVVSQDEVQSLKEASAQRCIRVCVLVVLFVCVYVYLYSCVSVLRVRMLGLIETVVNFLLFSSPQTQNSDQAAGATDVSSLKKCVCGSGFFLFCPL